MDGPPKRRLRILHIIFGLGAGGAEALLFRFAMRQSDMDHQIVSLVAPDWYSAELERHGTRLDHLHIHSSLSAIRALPRLWRIVRDSNADVVQTWMYRSNVYGGLVARLQGKPVVWGIHTGSLKPLRFAARFWAYAGGALARLVPDFIIHCSTSAEESHAKVGYSAAPAAVIPNGYDPSVYFPDPDAGLKLRNALGIASDAFVLGFIGRWARAKDVPTLVKALGLVRKRGIDFKALFAGAGLDRDNPELAALIREQGCEDQIILLGRRSDVPDIARASDLHLLSSVVEAFPNVVGETMLCGTPNAVTDVGDCALMVGNSGWVVPARSANSIADAIEQAFVERRDRPDAWGRRKSLARELIAARFTFDTMADAYEMVWRNAAGRKARRA